MTVVVVLCVPFLVSSAGCRPVVDPDLLPFQQIKAAVLAAPDLDHEWREALEAGRWEHSHFTDSSIFSLPLKRIHKLYAGTVYDRTTPLSFAFAVSMRTGKALLLTGAPGSYTELLRLEGLCADTETRATWLMEEGVELTRIRDPLIMIVHSFDDIPYGPQDRAKRERQRAELGDKVQSLRAIKQEGGGYVGRIFVLDNGVLIERTATLSADGVFSCEDRAVMHDVGDATGAYW